MVRHLWLIPSLDSGRPSCRSGDGLQEEQPALMAFRADCADLNLFIAAF